MCRLFSGGLAAVVLAATAAAGLTGAAKAEGSREYLILGCDQSFGPPPPGTPPTLFVVSSSTPEDIGQPCEVVLNSLADLGFRLFETQTGPIGPPPLGVLHYLERVNDDDD